MDFTENREFFSRSRCVNLKFHSWRETDHAMKLRVKFHAVKLIRLFRNQSHHDNNLLALRTKRIPDHSIVNRVDWFGSSANIKGANKDTKI